MLRRSRLVKLPETSEPIVKPGCKSSTRRALAFASPQEENLLRQQLLGFETAPRTPLEKIPVKFRYQFRCTRATWSGHRIMCTD